MLTICGLNVFRFSYNKGGARLDCIESMVVHVITFDDTQINILKLNGPI